MCRNRKNEVGFVRSADLLVDASQVHDALVKKAAPAPTSEIGNTESGKIQSNDTEENLQLVQPSRSNLAQGTVVEALFAFESSEDNELSFLKVHHVAVGCFIYYQGDRLEVVDAPQDGWLQAKSISNDMNAGWVPESYLRVMDKDE